VKRFWRSAALAIAALALSACSTGSVSNTQNSAEAHWNNEGLRFPASTSTNASLEERFCSGLSTFNMKISKAKGAIPRAECRELITRNVSVCSYFSFCEADKAKSATEGQSRARVNLLVDSLNQKIAEGHESIRAIDNLKFKKQLKSSAGAVGFNDLLQTINSGPQKD
jgi:hypothetical protein